MKKMLKSALALAMGAVMLMPVTALNRPLSSCD